MEITLFGLLVIVVLLIIVISATVGVKRWITGELDSDNDGLGGWYISCMITTAILIFSALLVWGNSIVIFKL